MAFVPNDKIRGLRNEVLPEHWLRILFSSRHLIFARVDRRTVLISPYFGLSVLSVSYEKIVLRDFVCRFALPRK